MVLPLIGVINRYCPHGYFVGVAYTMFYQSKKVFSLSNNKLEMYQYARIAMDEISRDLKGAILKDTVDYFRSR